MSFKGGKKSNVYESPEGYDLYAPQYDEYKNLAYLKRFEEDVVDKFLRDVKGMKVLDVGCGTGRIVADLRREGAVVSACDVSEKMVQKVNEKFTRLEAIVGDIEELPYSDGEFDFVVALFVVVHLKDLRDAFDEVYRVLKDGGVFVLSNINQRKAPKLKLEDKREIVIESYYHRPEDILKALEDSFFRIEKEEFVRDGGVWVNQIIRAIK